jgi:hypothetical protein
MNDRYPTIHPLGDGLILRRSTPADAEALADFCARIHSDQGPEQPNENIAAWTRDLLAKPHPTFQAEDFTIVADSSGHIVSTLNLIPQTWLYEGIPFQVGRPELVGTLPEYRGRGLVRRQFEEIHRWSAERGDLVQAITGIPYFYRQFGYEMALDLGGRRWGYEATVPVLPDGEPDPYRLRPAGEADIPFLAGVYEASFVRYLLACRRTPEIWRYEMLEQSEASANHYQTMVLETAGGKPVGYLQHAPQLSGSGIVLGAYELKTGVSWLATAPSVARYLWQQGQAYARRDGGACATFNFALGAGHPAYDALGTALPGVQEPYAWYLRVPDVPALVRCIAPVLEQRLAASVAAGHSGELKLSFYRDGLRLAFEQGRLAAAQGWQPGGGEHAAFPGLTFLQALFGYRSLHELHHAFADCYWTNSETLALLNSLFPQKPSHVMPIS